MAGMARFTLKDLLIGTTIASAGLAMIALAIHWRMPLLSEWEGAQAALAGAGAWTTACGITRPFQQQNETRINFFVRFVVFLPILVAVMNAVRWQK
jgi:hypothetical protein